MKKLIFLLAAMLFFTACTQEAVPQEYYISTANSGQIVTTADGQKVFAFLGWFEGEDYTDRRVLMIDENNEIVKQMNFPYSERNSHHQCFMTENYVLDFDNAFGVDEVGRLYGVKIYSTDGKMIASDNLTEMDADRLRNDPYLKENNLSLFLTRGDGDSVIMHNHLHIYCINPADVCVTEIACARTMAEKLSGIYPDLTHNKDNCKCRIQLADFTDGSYIFIYRPCGKEMYDEKDYITLQYKDGALSVHDEWDISRDMYFDFEMQPGTKKIPVSENFTAEINFAYKPDISRYTVRAVK